MVSCIEAEAVDLLPPCPLRVDVHVPVPATASLFPIDLLVVLGSSPHHFQLGRLPSPFKGFLKAPHFPVGMKSNCSPNTGAKAVALLNYFSHSGKRKQHVVPVSGVFLVTGDVRKDYSHGITHEEAPYNLKTSQFFGSACEVSLNV